MISDFEGFGVVVGLCDFETIKNEGWISFSELLKLVIHGV
jgi:hypothetical protein